MKEVNFQMLPIAREARGLTQEELVSKISNLSQGNYSRMEKGLLSIPYETIVNIASELNFPLSYFSLPTPIKPQAEYYYRKRVTMPRKQQIKLEANFDLIRLWMEGLLKDVDVPDFDIPTIEVAGNNTPIEIARKIRFLLSLPKGPIDKLVNTLERHGIMIYFMKDAPDKFDGTTVITDTGQIIIVINYDIPNDRKRFTIAHELGHNIMHIPYYPILDPDRDTESEANAFASEFLMPEMDIRRDLIHLRFSVLGDLKQFWKVSKSSLIKRAFDLKYIDKTKYTNMMIELSRLGERKTEKSPVEIDQPQILSQMLNTYLNQLNYSRSELSDIIGISYADYDRFLLGKEPGRAKFKILV
jgi:Zn-dependent peptidase ImmA (M78 family)